MCNGKINYDTEMSRDKTLFIFFLFTWPATLTFTFNNPRKKYWLSQDLLKLLYMYWYWVMCLVKDFYSYTGMSIWRNEIEEHTLSLSLSFSLSLSLSLSLWQNLVNLLNHTRKRTQEKNFPLHYVYDFYMCLGKLRNDFESGKSKKGKS